MTTIGGLRTFFLDVAWRLPDLPLVIAGPFQESRLVGMADRSQYSAFGFRLTKHLSKHYLFQQRRAGYRPPAWKRKLDADDRVRRDDCPLDDSGEKARHHSPTQLGRRKKSSAARPLFDRRRRRLKGEREAIGDRPATRLGTAEKPATLQGQSVAGYRRDRRAFDGWHSSPRDRRTRNPACRGPDYRPTATPRPHHAGSRLIDRGAEQRTREDACVDATATAVDESSSCKPRSGSCVRARRHGYRSIVIGAHLWQESASQRPLSPQ